MHQIVRAFLAAVSTAFLVACGGGAVSDDAPAPAASLRNAPQRAARTVDATALMDWAEREFAQYFTSHQPNRSIGPYVYRDYGNGIYLGLAGDTVLVMGLLGPDRFAIVEVGRISDFACRVYPENCPVISGVAAKGLLNGATVGVYDMNADGSRGALLASATTGADGRFSVALPALPAGPVVVEAQGGTYVSAYDGTTLASRRTMSAVLAGVSVTGESGISVNPLSDMAASLTRFYLSQNYSLAASLTRAGQWVAWQYGLSTDPARVIPQFDVAAATTDPEGVQLALVLAALDTLGKRAFPADPDIVFAALSYDFHDGMFDGRQSGQQITVGGQPLPAGIGSTDYMKAFGLTFSATTAGWRPGYVDAHFNARTISERYEAQLIPVYVASEVAAYYPPRYSSPLPNTASLDTSRTGYACPAGAPITFSNGVGSCGSYSSCSGGATLLTVNGRESCSDGGIPVYQAATIAPYTAVSIAPYTASTIEPYQAQTAIAQPAAGTIPIFRATAVHVFTEAERAEMMANDSRAGDMAAARVSSLGTPTALQLEWMQRINDAVMASVRW